MPIEYLALHFLLDCDVKSELGNSSVSSTAADGSSAVDFTPFGTQEMSCKDSFPLQTTEGS